MKSLFLRILAAISTGEAVTYAQGGSGVQADLTDGTVYY